jgi:hypothetical protein
VPHRVPVGLIDVTWQRIGQVHNLAGQLAAANGRTRVLDAMGVEADAIAYPRAQESCCAHCVHQGFDQRQQTVVFQAKATPSKVTG